LYNAIKKWHKGGNTPSFWSPVVEEERMKSGHQLGLVLSVTFSALTPLVSDRKDIRHVNKTSTSYPQTFSTRTSGRRKLRETGKMAFKWKWH